MRRLFILLFLLSTFSSSAQFGIIARDIAEVIIAERAAIEASEATKAALAAKALERNSLSKIDVPVVSNPYNTSQLSNSKYHEELEKLRTNPSTIYKSGIHIYYNGDDSHPNTNEDLLFQNEYVHEAYDCFSYFKPYNFLRSNSEQKLLVEEFSKLAETVITNNHLLPNLFNAEFLKLFKQKLVLIHKNEIPYLKYAPYGLKYNIMLYQADHDLKITGILDNTTVNGMLFESNSFGTYYYKQYCPGCYNFNPSINFGALYTQFCSHELAIQCLEYLVSDNLLPSNFTQIDELSGRISLLKYQISKGLKATGKLDITTIHDILQSKKSTINKNLKVEIPNSLNHAIEAAFRFQGNDINWHSNENNISYGVFTGLGLIDLPPSDKNAVYLHRADKVLANNSSTIMKMMNDFAMSLPNNLSNLQDKAFLLTCKTEKDGNILAFVYFVDNRFVAYLHSYREIYFDEERFTKELRYIKSRNLSLVWVGDDIKGLNVADAVDKQKIPLFKRFKEISKTLPNLLQTENKILDLNKISIFNATPRTISELKSAGFSLLGLKQWQTLADKIDDKLASLSVDQLTQQKSIKDEITKGKNDLVLVIAHSDGFRLYFNGESMSIDDIKNWKVSDNQNSNRIAILLTCDAANNRLKRGVFRRRLESFTELLIDKGYFGLIVAPDHEISGKEVITVLENILSGKSLSDVRAIFPGWHRYVFVNENKKRTNLIALK